MKKYFTLAFILIVLFNGLKAQQFDWLQTYQVNYEFNPGMIHYNTCANPQGGSYFYGIQEHISFYNESMGVLFLKKFSQDGDETWSRSISGQSCVDDMVCNDNGDVYISGQLLEDADFWGEGSLEKTGIGTDGFVAGVSSEGELNWAFNLTGLPMGEGTITNLVINNGLLYIAYSTWINTYVLIFSEDGEYLDVIEQEDVGIISGLDFDDEGNLYACGGCAGWAAAFGGVPYPAPFSYTTYLVKYNPDFEPVWVKYIEDATCTFPQVKIDDEGWIYFAGSLMIETVFDTIAVNGPSWLYDFYIARLNPEGEYQWVRECPEVMTGDATVGDMHFLDTDLEGNALLSGITRGVVDWGNGIISDVTANYQDMIFWNFSPDGVVNWIKTAGGQGFEQASSLSASDDGGAYIAGVISGEGYFDTIYYETTSYVSPFLAWLDLGILSGVPEDADRSDIAIYPNPAKDRIFVHSGKDLSGYWIYNINGQLIKHNKILQGESEIKIQALKAGYYIFKFETRNGEFVNVPFIAN